MDYPFPKHNHSGFDRRDDIEQAFARASKVIAVMSSETNGVEKIKRIEQIHGYQIHPYYRETMQGLATMALMWAERLEKHEPVIVPTYVRLDREGSGPLGDFYGGDRWPLDGEEGTA
jgi:hypothetical protein